MPGGVPPGGMPPGGMPPGAMPTVPPGPPGPEQGQGQLFGQQAMGKMLRELEKMGYVARNVDSKDKRAKEITLTELGVKLAQDSLAVYDEVHAFYVAKVGESELAALEAQLRRAVGKLALEYLPESWQQRQDPG